MCSNLAEVRDMPDIGSHENCEPYQLSPQQLSGNSCTCAQA